MNGISYRYRMLGILLTVLGLVIVLQVGRLQFDENGKTLREYLETISWVRKRVQPVRGEIYDRNGALLAGNNTMYEIGVNLNQLPIDEGQRLDWEEKLNWSTQTVLNLSKPYIMLKQEALVYNPDLIYLTIAKHATPKQAKELYRIVSALSRDGVKLDVKKVDAKNKLPLQMVTLNKNPLASLANKSGLATLDEEGEEDIEAGNPLALAFTRHLERTYPEKNLAANILGFVSFYDNQGHNGVEEKYEKMLAGNTKVIDLPLDPNRAGEVPYTTNGTTLILTIEREMQSIIEAITDKTLEDSGAASVSIVVMQPKTGEILAMASTPRMDLNRFFEYGKIFGDPEKPAFFNRGIHPAYEPGSVFKIFTMAAALDSGAVTPETRYNDTTGLLSIDGYDIRNWHGGAGGDQDMMGCMQHSLNVCLSWIALKLGPEKFYLYMEKFGIGHHSGIDLALESPGLMRTPRDEYWRRSALGANSFGQNLMVTPVQMLMAASSIANGGEMMLPHVVRAVVEGGRQREIPPQVVGSPISAKTAHTLTSMLTQSLVGESSTALVEGYQVAGKTGTASIPRDASDGGPAYELYDTNASFIGWGPSDDPQFLVYIWLERPQSSVWGSEVAAPVFSEVVQRIVVLMDIPPDDIRHQLMAQKPMQNAQTVR